MLKIGIGIDLAISSTVEQTIELIGILFNGHTIKFNGNNLTFNE